MPHSSSKDLPLPDDHILRSDALEEIYDQAQVAYDKVDPFSNEQKLFIICAQLLAVLKDDEKSRSKLGFYTPDIGEEDKFKAEKDKLKSAYNADDRGSLDFAWLEERGCEIEGMRLEYGCSEDRYSINDYLQRRFSEDKEGEERLRLQTSLLESKAKEFARPLEQEIASRQKPGRGH